MTAPFDLTGRVALVTGASRGIGRAIAEALRAAGAAVHLHGRDFPEADDELAAAFGGDVWRRDLADPGAVDALADEFRERVGTLDVLVNNAGVELAGTADQVEAANFARTFQVNVTAAAQLVRGLLPLLRASSSPSVVNISSIHDRTPSYGNLAYAASKAALRSLTENLAVELGPEGIRVNGVSPGAVATDINRSVLEEIGVDDFAQWIPLGRVGEVGDVGVVVVFLASPAAAYVTGTTVVVDGGYSLNLLRYRILNHGGEGR